MDRNGKTGRRYSAEEKAAAVRMVRTLRAELGTDRGTAQRVALQLGYGERLAEIGAVPSIGSVGDSFDNALAETVNGY